MTDIKTWAYETVKAYFSPSAKAVKASMEGAVQSCQQKVDSLSPSELRKKLKILPPEEPELAVVEGIKDIHDTRASSFVSTEGGFAHEA